jgi:hypothetical protein
VPVEHLRFLAFFASAPWDLTRVTVLGATREPVTPECRTAATTAEPRVVRVELVVPLVRGVAVARLQGSGIGQRGDLLQCKSR